MTIRLISAGDIVEFDDGEYLVGEILVNAVKLRETGTAEYRVVALEELSAVVTPVSIDTPTALPGELDRLTESQLTEIRALADHLEEMLTGVHPKLPHVVNPLYRKNIRRLDRAKTKSEELRKLGFDISSRTLLRKAQKYAPAPGVRNLAGLIDLRRLRRADPVASIPPEFYTAISTVMRTVAADGATMTLRGNRDDIIRAVDREYAGADFAMPTDDTLRRWINAIRSGKYLQRTAKQRNSVNKRGNWVFNSRKAIAPGHEVQVDSSPFDILVRDEHDNIHRATLAAMIDKRTRGIAATGVFDDANNGFDLTVLLARSLAPRRVRRATNRLLHLDLPPMPWVKDLTEDERADYDERVPFIYPQRLIMDNGADWRSDVFMSACAQFGIDVTIAPPGSPTWKAIIEKFFDIAMRLFAERLPGFISRDPAHRPRKLPPVETLLTIDQLAELWDEWVVVVWQNRAHEGLVDPQARGRRLTPNQMYLASYDVTAPVALPITRDDYIGLLPVAFRTVQPDGITIATRRYDSPRLLGFRNRKSGDAHHDDKWAVRYDPYDPSAVWLQDPTTDEWIECDWMNQRWVGEPHQEFIRKQLNHIRRTTPTLDNDAASAMVLDALRALAPNQAHTHKLKRRRARALTERSNSGMPALRKKAAENLDDIEHGDDGGDFIEIRSFDPKRDR
ncbi:Mu transposase C-terminal domain-containing protein [Curtobacterium luteum]|uniref:Mu transposase C-terminal domain-containing protein n=1 Tax=Curtobacterium luteum TaxID=33881 RepID=UPI00382019D9